MSATDIAIVGAGIIGAACARELQARGLSCVLIDAEEPGHGASFGNAGIIATEQLDPLAAPGSWREVPDLLLGRGPASMRWRDLPTVLPWSLAFLRASRPGPFARHRIALHQFQAGTADAWRALAAQVPEVGRLTHFVGHDEVFETEPARLAAQAGLLRQREDGVNWRDLDDAELEAIRRLAPRAHSGVHFADTGMVDLPLGIVQALVRDFLRRGGRQLRARIERIEARPQHFDMHTRAAVIPANRVLISAGARSAPLLRRLGLPAPLIAERGYHFSFSRPLPGMDRPLALRERAVVMTPMQFGFRSTSFVEFATPGSQPSPAKWRRLQYHLQEAGIWQPGDAPDAWMGERPTLPDYLPGMGESRQHPGLYYALGHQHLGLTLSAPTAQAMADLITSGKRASFLDALDLMRFR